MFTISAGSAVRKNADYIFINENCILRDINNAETLSNDINTNFEDKKNVFAIFSCKFFRDLKNDIFSLIITFNLIKLIDS